MDFFRLDILLMLFKIISQSFKNFFIRYWIAIFTGALVAFAFPPFRLGFLGCISLLPLLYWSRAGSLKTAFKTGYWWGFGFHTGVLFWILNSTILGGVVALLFLPLFTAVSLLLFRWLYMKYGSLFLGLFPFLWTAIEYLRTLSVFGFPWQSIAHTQTYFPSLIQYVDFTGVYGVTFWICLINVLVFMLIERVRKLYHEVPLGSILRDLQVIKYALPVVLLFIAPLIYGMQVMSSGTWLGDTLKVSLVQGNVDMDEKTDAELRDSSFVLYDLLSLQAAKAKPDLIVWPETAALSFLKYNPKYDAWMRKIVEGTQTPILTGCFDAESIVKNGLQTYKSFNAAVLYNDEKSPGTWYGKIHLVPFGEWFPYEDRFQIFESLYFGQADFTPGNKYTIFSLGLKENDLTEDEISTDPLQKSTVKFSTAICFESVFPDFIQKFSKKGAQFLVVITNNNWFGRTSSLYQHAQISVFRAIENRFGVAHCSNSGISILIDPYGRVTGESGVFVDDILTGEVYYRDAETTQPFYTQHGELFSQATLIISGIFFIGGFFRKKRQSF